MRRKPAYRFVLPLLFLAAANLVGGAPTAYRVLIVPIDFPDLPGTVDPAQVETLYASQLRTFLGQVSNGDLVLETTVLSSVSRLPHPRWHYNHRAGISPDPRGLCQDLFGELELRICRNDDECNPLLGPRFKRCRFQTSFCDDRTTPCLDDTACAGIGSGICRPLTGVCSDDLTTACRSSGDCGVGAHCRMFLGPWETDDPLAAFIPSELVVGPNGLAPATAPDDNFDAILFVDAIPDDCATCTETRTTPQLCRLYGWMGGGTLAVDPPPDPDTPARRYKLGFAPLTAKADACVLETTDYGEAAHELGHAISGGRNHPAGYVSAYELMDSSYPCTPGVYTRVSNAVVGAGYPVWFPGWIPDAKVTVFTPSSGGGTELLAPVETDPSTTASPLGLKVETADGRYYIVECRKSTDPDFSCYNDGVLIMKAAPPGEWNADDPDKVLEMMVNPDLMPAEERWKSYFLEGHKWQDSDNDVQIDVGPILPDGACTVTVTYGPESQASAPDMAMLPWLSEPLNTYETIDIWVDSSCNGYADDDPADPSRLRYGRRPDGTVIGNGDDPCLEHPNRIYANVRNLGQSNANNVIVDFDITDPIGVGIRGPDGWREFGSLGSFNFPCLGSIPPGGSCEVYVEWTPTAADIAAGVAIPSGNTRFGLHTCLRNRIDPVGLETLFSNQDGVREQENISLFEMRRDPGTMDYERAESYIFLNHANNPTRTGSRYQIEIDSSLPAGWMLQIGDGRVEYDMVAGQTRAIPVSLHAPPGTPPGQTYGVALSVYASRPSDGPDPSPNGEESYRQLVSGLVLQVQTVIDTQISLTALALPADSCFPQSILVEGCLSEPVAGVQLTVDYDGPGGLVAHLATTDGSGCFQDTLGSPGPGTWSVKALWPGDPMHSSALSPTVAVPTFDPADQDCDQVPDVNDNCAGASNPQQADSDQDGRGDLCDCDPADAGVFAIPPEVTNVNFLADKQTLSWDTVTSSSGPDTFFELLTGTASLPAPVGSEPADSCVDSTIQGPSFPILDVPPPGGTSWYLVRAKNPCGTGTLGTRSDGSERVDPTCLSCDHDRCTAGVVLDPGCDTCAGEICAVDPYCCDTLWDSICIEEVQTVCGILECQESQGVCPHGLCNEGAPLVEQCDAPPALSSCVSEICAIDLWCCTTDWDQKCVDQVGSVCGNACP
jgi:hypothetical protein